MPDFLIRCKGDPRYTVRLDNCSFEHAQVALESLRRNPFVPDGLDMERTDTHGPDGTDDRGGLLRRLRKS